MTLIFILSEKYNKIEKNKIEIYFFIIYKVMNATYLWVNNDGTFNDRCYKFTEKHNTVS